MSSSRGKGSKHGLAESQSNNIIITCQQGLNYILSKATEAMASDAHCIGFKFFQCTSQKSPFGLSTFLVPFRELPICAVIQECALDKKSGLTLKITN